MRCQSCKKNDATIHLTEINEGVRTELHLCERCAQQEGISVKSHIPLNELLCTLLGAQPEDGETLDDAEQRTCCPHCGFSLDQFRKEPLLGCPYDYEMFEKALLPLIEKAHGGKTSHCGKVPSKQGADTRKQIQLISLRQQLEAAVKTEDYEQAAQLRDKINQLE